MKVFISWSGEYSGKVAELLKSWLEDVFQDVEAWISKEDISKGEIWFTGLSDTLAKTDFGILCLTAENVVSPWILFEAGALSKGLSKSRVCPLLIDFEASRLTPPLSQFNAARPTKPEMGKLVEAINVHGGNLLAPEKLSKAFERWWEEFDSKFEAIKKQQGEQPSPPKRPPEEMIVEILETVRALQKSAQKPPRTSMWDGVKLSDLPTPETSIAELGARAFTLHPNVDGSIDIYRTGASALNLYRQAIESFKKSQESGEIKEPEAPPPE